MRSKWLIILILFPILCGATRRPDDSNTAHQIPTNNAAFTPNLQTFLGEEAANTAQEEGLCNFVDNFSTNSITAACLGAIGAGLTMTPGACIAYNAGYRSTCGVGNNLGLGPNGTVPASTTADCPGGNSITFPDASTCWVAMDENTVGNNAGIPNFTRVTGTHYLTDCIDTTLPAMAYDSQLLMEVTTTGGSITNVLDLRELTPFCSTAIPPAPGTFAGSCSANTTTCTGNGGNTLLCSGGVADFKAAQGVYIANGSTTACTIGGSACPTPSAPTIGVAMSSRLQGCTDITATTTSSHGQYVSAGLCNFSFLQPNDTLWISGGSAAGDNGFFTVLTATATTLRVVAASITGEVPGASFNFQTTVPIGGGTIAIGNMVDDVGVVLDPEQRPFNQVTEAPSYGTYNLSVTSNVGTYTFGQPDEGKPVTIYYQTNTPPTGTTVYKAVEFARDGIKNGWSPPSAAASVSTATLSFPNFVHGMPFLFMIPSAVAGAEAYDMWESDNTAAYYWSTRVWPNTTYLNTAVTLPTTVTCIIGGESNCIQTGSTLGFPMNNTLNIGGQIVTCTGVKADAIFNCTGGTGTFNVGTPIISTQAPRLHVAYGGGLQYGQDPWSSEAWPQGSSIPVAQGNDDFTPTAPPTITAITAGSMTLSAPIATGTWTVQHTDQNALATAFQQMPTFGGVLQLPAGCISRFCQMPFDQNHSIASIIYVAGQVGQLQGSEFRSYCDGGGMNAINAVEQPATGTPPLTVDGIAIGAVGNPGHLDMHDLAVTSTNSGLSVLLNENNQFFNETRLKNISLAAHPFVNTVTGSNSRTGASHTTGINVRLGTLTAANIVTRYVDSPVWINAGVNGWWIQGTGSFNQASSARLWSPMLGYAGAGFNGNLGPAVIDEIPWTAMRPLDGNPGDTLQDFTMTNSYLGDVDDWGPNAPVRGTVVDYGGSSGVFIGGFFGQNQSGLGGIYINGSSQGNHANLIENNVAAGVFGILVDNAGTATMTGVNVSNLGNNKTGIECRGNCSARNSQETIVFGATGAIGFKAGYKPDETTCNTTSSTDFNYHNAELTFLANDVSFCPTAASAIITNDLGTQVLQGVQPTVGTCGTTPVQPAYPSSNVGLTWTMGTGGPTACTITFTTAAQGTGTQKPNCLFQDVTHPAITITDAPTVAPTATDVLTFSGSATSDVVKGQCGWSN